jgi:hypothetical protein
MDKFAMPPNPAGQKNGFRIASKAAQTANS